MIHIQIDYKDVWIHSLGGNDKEWEFVLHFQDSGHPTGELVIKFESEDEIRELADNILMGLDGPQSSTQKVSENE